MLYNAISAGVPGPWPHDILVLPMKTWSLIFACGLLAACAGPDYREVEPADGGAYVLAQSPASVTHLGYRTGHYSPLVLYGLYPWWSYSYYSPNFYPHHFSFWYPTWPYYRAGMYAGWYGGNHPGFGSYHLHPAPSPPGVVPVIPQPTPPLVVGPADPRRGRHGDMDERDLYRSPAMIRHGVDALTPRADFPARPGGPTAAASTARPTVRSLFSPARSRPAFAPGPRADTPRPSASGRQIERSHRPADRSPPHHER